MRTVKEWSPKSSDTPIPNRVRLRVYDRYEGKCSNCGNEIGVRNPWEVDHKIALANGGLHAESNLRPLCRPCHLLKTKKDVIEKALIYSIRSKHIGLKKRKHIMPGSRASKWKKHLDGRVTLR